MPSETDKQERRAIDAKLCEIAARLKLTAPPSP